MKITIDAIYLLLLGEISLILLVTTIYLFIKNRRYRKLYQKAIKELSDIKSQDSEVRSQQESKSKAVEFPQIEPQPDQETPPKITEEQLAAETIETPQASADTAETLDEGSLVVRINQLQDIINFQKGKILDLMCYKDILEQAGQRLSSLYDGYHRLKERFVRLLGESPENRGVLDSLESFEKNNSELKSFIDVLDRENNALTEKFRIMEEELKEIWQKVEQSEAIDEGKYTEIMKEKDELIARLKDIENSLNEKTKLLDDMQKQYEELEKEYMILYRQQQQQKG